jgi:hypothetical protein
VGALHVVTSHNKQSTATFRPRVACLMRGEIIRVLGFISSLRAIFWNKGEYLQISSQSLKPQNIVKDSGIRIGKIN